MPCQQLPKTATLKLRVNPRFKKGCLTYEQMQFIAANLVIDLGSSIRLVSYTVDPPSDITLPWQQVDECAGMPVGTVKHYRGGRWQ